jgi:Zn-finger nucleic acid-binding protein
MDHHSYGASDAGEVMIDSCDTCCQVWLDHGALRKLVLTVVSEGSVWAQERKSMHPLAC